MYDVVIIGAGPGGMTSALYAARANLKVALIEKALPGGQMNNTDIIENYPSYNKIEGQILSEKMFEQLQDYPIDFFFEEVLNITYDDDYKFIQTNDQNIKTKTIIISSGTKYKLLNVKGEKEYTGKGVSYCAICDGMFFKNKEIAVIGGGDSAIEEALYLTEFAKKVYVIHRNSNIRANPIYYNKALNNNKIEFILNATLMEINGNSHVSSIKINKDNKEINMNIDGIFIYIGSTPNLQFLKDDFIQLKNGWIETNENMETNIQGVFAVGDVRYKNLKQVSTAVGDGAIAGQEVYNYIKRGVL